ncbi:E3 ubiquitin-protein ligase [Pelomyxa schiedti]|nr:E3 ubiquitin-protein ligase [Pelomyxa schiedti]
MQTVREALLRAKIDVKPLEDLHFDLDVPLSHDFVRQLAENCEDMDAPYYKTVSDEVVRFLSEKRNDDDQLRDTLREIGMDGASDSLSGALETLGKPCTVAVLREVLSLPEIPPPLAHVFNSKRGWLPKLRRRLVPMIDPGGTPSSTVDSFPGKLTEAGFQDLEDLVGLDSGDFQRLTESLKIPRGSANKLLQQSKALVGDGKKVLYHTLKTASVFNGLITTAQEAQNGNTANKVTLVSEKVLNLINMIRRGCCSPSGDSIAFDKLDEGFVTIGLFGDLRVVIDFLVRIGALPEGKKLPENNGQAEIHALTTQFSEESEMRGKPVMILVFVPGSTSFSNVQESDPACLFLRFLYSLCDKIFMCLSEPMLAELQNETGEAETTRVVECEVETPSIQDRCEFEKGFAQNLSLPSSDSPWKMIQCDNSVSFVCCEEINESTLVSPIRGQIPAYYFAPHFKDLLHGKELCTDALCYAKKLALLRLLNPTAAQSVEDGNKGPLKTLQKVVKLMVVQHFQHEWELLNLKAPHSPSGSRVVLDQTRLRNTVETYLSQTTSVVFLFEEFCPVKTESQLRDFLSLTEHEMKQRITSSGSEAPRPHIPLSTLSSLGFEPHFVSEITSLLKRKFMSQFEALIKEIQAAVCNNPDEFCGGTSFSLELDTAIRKETPHTTPEKMTLTVFQQSTDKANPHVSFDCQMAVKLPRHMKFTVVESNMEKTAGFSNVTLAPPFCFDVDVVTVLGCFLLPGSKVMVVGVDAEDPSNYLICIHHEGTRFLSSKLRKKGGISQVNFCATTRILVMCYSSPDSSVCALKFNDSYSKYDNLGSFPLDNDAALASVKGIFPVPEGQKVVVTFPTVAKLFDFENRTISELPQLDGPALFLGPEFFLTVKPSLPVVSGTVCERESCHVSVRSCHNPSIVQNWETNLLDSCLLPSTLLVNFRVGEGAQEPHLIQFNPTSGEISSVILCAVMKHTKFSLQMVAPVSRPSCSPLKYLLDASSKFPITAVCDVAREEKPHKLTVVVPSATPEAKRLVSKRLQEYKDKLVRLCKTLGTADKFFTEHVTCSIDQGWFEIEPLRSVEFGTWLKTLISLVPIQIARVDNNCLVLCNTASSQGKTVRDSTSQQNLVNFTQTQHSVAEGISFGLLDAIFSSCFNKPVLVVTSMGKQSTGKSYTLNHLLGVLFDISGGRCTDGCWMSVREYSDCLIVALDFEGLCSPERSEQEDILLSLLNASVSNLTLFKLEFRIDRETEKMFRNFQEGVGMLKGDDKLFKGCFTLMAKDVSERDIESLSSEFNIKFKNIVETNQGQNFLSQMFPGKFTMIMCSPLGTTGYNDSLISCAEILRKQTPQFRSGGEFSSMLKLILAKLHLKDWSSLQGQDRVIMVRMLQEQLPWAVSCGSKSISSGHEGQLVNLSTGEVVPRPESVTISGVGIPIPNFNLQADREADFTRIRDELKCRFENYLSKPLKQSDFRPWHSQFSDFVHQVIESRKRHVKDWDECPEVQAFLATVEFSLRGLDSLEDNTTAMDLTNVKLSALIASPRARAPIRQVTMVITTVQEVTNATRAALSRAKQQHLCGEKCSACGPERPCGEPCALPCEDHRKHDCGRRRCLHSCSFPKCTNPCASTDHFHGTAVSVSVYPHLCDKEHDCQSECEVPGWCRVEYIQKVENLSYNGHRQSFVYERSTVPEPRKHSCCKRVPPGRQVHEGSHSCTYPQSDHRCKHSCPTCGYICELNFGHPGKHAAAHGNMIKTQFVSSGKDIDLDGRLYEAGEPGVAEICNLFCNKLGRHIHILPCTAQGDGPCVHTGAEGRRHATVRYLPDSNIPKDELTHESYWNSIGFRDPCTAEHREIFKLCDFECGENRHTDPRCRCMLPLWHARSSLQVNESKQFECGKFGFASSDGHIFLRKHGPPENMHIVLCLDASTSMNRRSRWQTLVRGVEQFISARNKPRDVYSIVLFHGQGIVACDRVSPDQARANITREPHFGGDTKFSSGLSVAYRKLMETDWSDYRAALIFMSDGEDENSEWESSMLNIRQLAHQRTLSTYVIGIGDGFNSRKLRSVAETGGAQFVAVDAVCTNLATALQTIDSRAGQPVALMNPLLNLNPPPTAQLRVREATSTPTSYPTSCFTDLRNSTKKGGTS